VYQTWLVEAFSESISAEQPIIWTGEGNDKGKIESVRGDASRWQDDTVSQVFGVVAGHCQLGSNHAFAQTQQWTYRVSLSHPLDS
jgi:hypothetical protein